LIHARREIAPYRVPNWLPQDIEESIVGTEWHQEAAGALADVLREAAHRARHPSPLVLLRRLSPELPVIPVADC
jgi:hypothetical protein